MEFQFSECVNQLRSSAIRELLKLATRPDIISFAGGMPGNELFPVEEMRKMGAEFTRKEWEEGMQYGPTDGYPKLLESLKEWLRGRNFPVDTNELIITTGSLQAIDIIGKLFINPGDLVLTENPVFIGGVSAFKSHRGIVKGIDLDDNGIVIPQLQEALKENPKLLYITPNFHNPAGLTYSQERRKQLIDVMRNSDCLIIEDDAYGELYFDDEAYKNSRPMKTWVDPEMDRKILYVGSNSKIFGPGLRVAWALVPKEVKEKMSISKQCIDACTPSLSQLYFHKFLSTGQLDKYITFLRGVYKGRRDCMAQCIAKYFPQEISYVKPQGGFYYWIHLPEGVDEKELFDRCVERGAVFVIGSVFNPYAEKNGYIRVSYCNTPEEQIEKGIKIIGNVMKEIMAEKK